MAELEDDFFSINGGIDTLNSYLVDTPYHLCLTDERNITIRNSDGTMASRMALLPIQPKEIICSGDILKSTISCTIFVNGEWLTPIEVNDGLKNIDRITREYGLHKLPILSSKEYHPITVVFSTLALHMDAEKTYALEAGWLSDEKLLIKNILLNGNSITDVQNSVIKHPMEIADLSEQEVYAFVKDCYLAVLNNPLYAITMMLFLILGFLFPRIVAASDIQPDFLLYIVGGTGTRKTSTVSAMLNPFGFTSASFEDTLASVTELFRNMPLGCFIVDDLKRATPDAIKIFNKILRIAGDATTQSYKVRGGKVITQGFSSLCVITGERELHLQESSMARVLILPYDKETVNLDGLSYIQRNESKLRAAMLKIIQGLMQKPNLIDNLCNSVKEKRNELRIKYCDEKIHGRYYDMLAWLISIYNIVSVYFEKAGYPLNTKYPQLLQELVFNQNFRYANDPVRLFATYLVDLQNSNGLKIISEMEFTQGHEADVIDYNEEWFIASGVVFNKIRNRAEFVGEPLDFSEKQLRSELYDAQILKRRNGKNTYELRKGGNRLSGFYIRKSALFKVLERKES